MRAKQQQTFRILVGTGLGVSLLGLGIWFAKGFAPSALTPAQKQALRTGLESLALPPTGGSLSQTPRYSLRKKPLRPLFRLRPEWARREVTYARINGSFLDQTSATPAGMAWESAFRALNWNRSLSDPRSVWAMRAQYARLSDQYESQRVHGQAGLSSQRQHLESMRNFGDAAFQQMGRAVIRQEIVDAVLSDSNRARIRQWTEDLKQSQWVKEAGTPLGVVGLLASFSLGQPLKYEVKDQLRIVALANVINQSSEMRVSSPYLDSTMEYHGNTAVPNRERYRLTLGRSLPVWSLRSGVSYGSTSGLVTASLSRELYPNLVATALASRSADPQRTAFPGEESLSLNYRLSF